MTRVHRISMSNLRPDHDTGVIPSKKKPNKTKKFNYQITQC